MLLREWLSSCCFRFVHQHNLVYNTCWEDPRLDRKALRSGARRHARHDHLGGLQRPGLRSGRPQRIFCIDVNPRQNALLELKLAGIRRLEYPGFFALFSRGHWTEAPTHLSAPAAVELVRAGPAVLGPQHSLFLRHRGEAFFLFSRHRRLARLHAQQLHRSLRQDSRRHRGSACRPLAGRAAGHLFEPAARRFLDPACAGPWARMRRWPCSACRVRSGSRWTAPIPAASHASSRTA